MKADLSGAQGFILTPDQREIIRRIEAIEAKLAVHTHTFSYVTPVGGAKMTVGGTTEKASND